MLDAYLDESGIHDGAAVCVIAGYFGGRKWRKFEDDWKKLLKDFNVPMERFHASKLVPKAKGWFWTGGAGIIRRSWMRLEPLNRRRSLSAVHR